MIIKYKIVGEKYLQPVLNKHRMWWLFVFEKDDKFKQNTFAVDIK